MLNLSIQPQPYNAELITSSLDGVKEARHKSGLGLTLASKLVEFDVDYRLQSIVKVQAAAPESALSQQFRAQLRSQVLNELFGVDAGVRADTISREGGDIYRYQISPSVSRPLSDLAHLSVNYDYILNKPARQQLARERRGYSMVLDGSMQGGRLLWSSSYSNAAVFEDRLVLARATEALALKSRYRIGSSMHVELSSAFRHEKRIAGASEKVSTQRRYGATFAWSPSEQYLLAFKVNTLDEASRDQRDTFGSGTLSWFPRPHLELTFDYGDQVADGASGWMVHTRLDLNG